MGQAISLIILGTIAAASLTFSHKNSHSAGIGKIVFFQGIVGMLFSLWGVYSFISGGIIGIPLLQEQLVYRGITLLVNFMQIGIGYLLGIGMITQYVFSECEEAKKKGRERLLKMAPLQGKAGIAGLIIGLGGFLVFAFL